jgi:hypothetical protein
LTALKHYLPGAGEHMPWRLVDADLVALMPSLPHSRPSLPADNFRRAYACMCDYYRQPVRDEVVWDVEKIYASHGARTLRLDDFTHLTPKFVTDKLNIFISVFLQRPRADRRCTYVQSLVLRTADREFKTYTRIDRRYFVGRVALTTFTYACIA